MLNEVRAKQIRLNSIIQLNDFTVKTVDGCMEYTIVDAQVVNGLCTNPIIKNDLGQVCFLSCYSWLLYYLTRRIWDLHFVSSQLPNRCPLLINETGLMTPSMRECL